MQTKKTLFQRQPKDINKKIFKLDTEVMSIDIFLILLNIKHLRDVEI